MNEYTIQLNFLAIESGLAPMKLHRRLRQSQQEMRPSPSAMCFKLPEQNREEVEWPSYWVEINATSGFDEFIYDPEWHPDLTKRLTFVGLRNSAAALLLPDQFRVPENDFIQELSLLMREYPEGHETLVLQPYRLRATKQLGLLFDFHFRVRPGVEFNRKVQQLSLSLDRNGRRNLDYYADRSSRIRKYLDERNELIQNITLPGTTSRLVFSSEFTSVAADRLRGKSYVFSNGREHRSQFSGLRDHGPLKGLAAPPKLLFVFREQDRPAARILAGALRGHGGRGNFNFPGFKALFKTDIEIDANPVVLPDLSEASMSDALTRAMADRSLNPNVLPIIVLPNGDENGYLQQKALFSHSGLPTQVCTLRILQDEDSLKWAIGNLALQIFCKAGGQPWKVRPTAAQSLIIGISQSHKLKEVDGEHSVDKYFAFSVLTDSSGLFQQIQVLGESKDQVEYLAELKANLKQILEEQVDKFQRVVIHTSFKLRYAEMDAIQQIVKEVASSTSGKGRFAVIKVNQRSRFFGVNRSVNSLVPFEASKVWLGRHEYLIWFEGIFPDRPNVNKAFPGPTHLQFLRLSEDGSDAADEREMLQDLVNLSGANWRGFNAKSAPVSIFYCHLVADLVHDFHDLGLPLPNVKDIRPWFL